MYTMRGVYGVIAFHEFDYNRVEQNRVYVRVRV